MFPSPIGRAVAGAAMVAIAAIAGAACGQGGDRNTTVPAAAASVERVEAPSSTSARPSLAVRPKPGPSPDELSEGSNPLPQDSALQLPPIIVLEARAGWKGPTSQGVAEALRSRRLALAPRVRREMKSGRLDGDLIGLVLSVTPEEAPLLVHGLSDRRARIQATSLAATRQVITALAALQSPGLVVGLRPVSPDFADLAQPRSAARESDVSRRVVAAALSQVGVPYSWGGGNAQGPTLGTCAGYHGSIRPCPATRTVGFDCSGLTLFAYAQVGITLDHYAAFQWLEGRRIAVDALMPGDLVFFSPKSDGPGHMGMYVGGGRFVHAPRTGDVVKVSALADYRHSYMGAVRPR